MDIRKLRENSCHKWWIHCWFGHLNKAIYAKLVKTVENTTMMQQCNKSQIKIYCCLAVCDSK